MADCPTSFNDLHATTAYLLEPNALSVNSGELSISDTTYVIMWAIVHSLCFELCRSPGGCKPGHSRFPRPARKGQIGLWQGLSHVSLRNSLCHGTGCTPICYIHGITSSCAWCVRPAPPAESNVRFASSHSRVAPTLHHSSDQTESMLIIICVGMLKRDHRTEA